MKLYEIKDSILNVLEAIEEETDQTGLNAILNGLKEEKADKCLNIAAYIKGLNAEAEALKLEKKRLEDRARTLTNKSERLKEYLQFNLDPGEKFKDTRAVISWRKSQSVMVSIDPHDLPEKYRKVEYSALKSEIKADIKEGIAVPGCELVEKENIQIK